jgi:hypothetical protein
MKTSTLINWFAALAMVSASAVTSSHAGGLLGDLVGQLSPEAGKLVDSYSAPLRQASPEAAELLDSYSTQMRQASPQARELLDALQKRSSEQGDSSPSPVSPQH